ncbi:MAG: hypothetical protein GX811_07730 [Lentisphaerae bacterium]|nr:hypothetical protein [Lentisphaerota bacterium]
MSEVQELAILYAPKLAEGLFRAILFALEYEDWSTVKCTTILKEAQVRIEFQGLLIGGKPDTLDPDSQDPRMEITAKPKEITTEDRKPTFTLDCSFTSRTGNNVKFGQMEFRLYGDSESTGKIVESKFTKKSGELDAL